MNQWIISYQQWTDFRNCDVCLIPSYWYRSCGNTVHDLHYFLTIINLYDLVEILGLNYIWRCYSCQNLPVLYPLFEFTSYRRSQKVTAHIRTSQLSIPIQNESSFLLYVVILSKNIDFIYARKFHVIRWNRAKNSVLKNIQRRLHSNSHSTGISQNDITVEVKIMERINAIELFVLIVFPKLSVAMLPMMSGCGCTSTNTVSPTIQKSTIGDKFSIIEKLEIWNLLSSFQRRIGSVTNWNALEYRNRRHLKSTTPSIWSPNTTIMILPNSTTVSSPRMTYLYSKTLVGIRISYSYSTQRWSSTPNTT